jgi:hypothetical protein
VLIYETVSNQSGRDGMGEARNTQQNDEKYISHFSRNILREDQLRRPKVRWENDKVIKVDTRETSCEFNRDI